MTVVNEAGLYSVILSSRKPEAKAFKRWVTHEVLPAIRKTGKYNGKGGDAPGAPVAPQPYKPPKLPSGAQMHELRVAVDKKYMSAEDFRIAIGLPPKYLLQALAKQGSQEGGATPQQVEDFRGYLTSLTSRVTAGTAAIVKREVQNIEKRITESHQQGRLGFEDGSR